MKLKERPKVRRKMESVFNSSALLLALSTTMLLLSQFTDNTDSYMIDETLCVSSVLFTLSLLFAYIFLCDDERERIKDLALGLFTLAILSFITAGFFLVMELQSSIF